jgi:hypothetical protein
MNEPEKKLHVDESWKEQVEREKEAAKRAAPDTSSATAQPSEEESARRHAAETTGEDQPFGEPAGEPAAPREAAKSESRDYALPPPSLAFLLTTLGTQAMVALGEVPNPLTGKLERMPNQAKHFIDTLAMLEEKTAGNRTPEESALLSSLLHQLRMAYVAISSSEAG